MVDYEFLDYKYFLPIRWVFHCWASSPKNRWEFYKWRFYLLGWHKTSQQLAIESLIALKEEENFLREVYPCLVFNKANTLLGFINFTKKIYEQYAQGYVEFINPLGELERVDLK